MAAQTLDSTSLRRVIAAFGDALAAHRVAINNLNVYPVPDGDTGTNMSLTMRSVEKELYGLQDDMPNTCKGISHGSLMGARGNSGVIMSQILREFAATIAPHSAIDTHLLAAALTAAAKAAYTAVGNPVEGTILTVIRESAQEATESANNGDTICEVAQAARNAAAESLERTPSLLPVLAEAGVVDAGGAGLLLLYDALLFVLDERPLPEADATADEAAAHPSTLVATPAPSEEKSIADLRYEVMFLLDAPDDSIAGFKEAWAEVGDSIVVVGGDGLHNCHIHSDDIGAAIECAIAVGRPHKIRVTDLLDELVEESDWVSQALEPDQPTPASAPATSGPATSTPAPAFASGPAPATSAPVPANTPLQKVPTGVVAVGAGSGIENILKSMGAQAVVSGGQSANPSTEEILAAIQSIPADEVVVLPNNKNIVGVARQAKAHTNRPTEVVPTTSIIEALSCLVAYNPQASAATNAQTMAEACQDVVSGEVTQAVRDASSEAGAISKGDWLGTQQSKVVVVASTMLEAAKALLDKAITPTHELLTIIVGQDANTATTSALQAWTEAHHSDLEVEIHEGNQPLYPYLFGLE